MPVGILGIQGNYEKHRECLNQLGAKCLIVKKASELASLSGLVIPGGESTTLLKLLSLDFRQAIVEFANDNKAILATCAGVILLAKKVFNPEQESLAILDIDVERNAYGRQNDSFIAKNLRFEDQTTSSLEPVKEAIFIRAPVITRIGKDIHKMLEHNGDPVLVKQGNVMAATFHPELSNEQSIIHKFFLDTLD